MQKEKDFLSPALVELLTEKRRDLRRDLQACNDTLQQLKAGYGKGGSAEQIGRWETTKEVERKQIEIESQLALIAELLALAPHSPTSL